MKHPLPTAPKTLAVLRALHRGRRLTIWTAMVQLHVGALSQRIGDLKRLGWDIKDRWLKSDGARFKEYRMGK